MSVVARETVAEDVLVVVQVAGAEERHEAIARAVAGLLHKTSHVQLEDEGSGSGPEVWTMVEGRVRLQDPIEPAMDQWADRCAAAAREANGSSCALEIEFAPAGQAVTVYPYLASE